MGAFLGLFFWVWGGAGWGKGKERRTLGIELQDVDVAVCVRDGDVELLVCGEEGGCHHFDGVRRFAEESELVGIFLLFRMGQSVLSSLCMGLTTASEAYRVPAEPHPLHRIPH